MTARCCGGGGRGVDALHDHVISRRTLSQTIEWVASLAVEEIPGTAFAAVGLPHPTQRARAAVGATDPVAVDLYEVERAAGGGPCLATLATGTVNAVERTTDHLGPWPNFRAACVRHGVISVLAAPLVVGDAPLAVLGLYAESANAYQPAHVEVAAEFAASAAVVLANAADYWSARTSSESLAVAVESRAVIDQAKGIVMHTVMCGPDEAFRLLVEQSQFENRKVRDIAGELVASTTAGTRTNRSQHDRV